VRFNLFQKTGERHAQMYILRRK